MKAAFITLGCKLNFAETSTYERGFRQAGFETVQWKEKADLYLINSCAVTSTAEAKSRNMLHRCLALSPGCRVVITGCSAQLHPEFFTGAWKVFDNAHKGVLVQECLESLRQEGVLPQTGEHFPVPAERIGRVFPAFSSTERTRSFLKVQDGCDNFCAYCTVPFARGHSRSLPLEECLAMARKASALGFKEAVITGVNTGDWGRDLGLSFLDLLKELEKVEGIERYRISSIEPNLLTEEIIDWIAGGTKVQPHFHIPLQSGSDRILHSMGRHYDTALFRSRIEYVRSKMGDGVFFGIDVIAGLPAESEEDFARSLDFLREVRPAFIHCFPYSKRDGTRAAAMPQQVSDSVKKERVAELEKLSATLHEEFVQSQKGTRQKVLFESRGKDGSMGGYTGNYIRVNRPYNESLIGKITEVIL